VAGTGWKALYANAKNNLGTEFFVCIMGLTAEGTVLSIAY